MMRLAWAALAVVIVAGSARADDVFEVCKAESKHIVAGTGQLSIALIFPDDFPGRTSRTVLYPIGERLAVAEHAKVLLVADIDAAIALVRARKWSETADECSGAPGLAAVLGLKYPNLSSAHVSLACDKGPCELRVDLERHGRPSAERWVRYAAPLDGPADKLAVIAAAAHKLKAIGPPPDAPKAGLAVTTLAEGVVTTRSDADGALELDRAMEANPAFAACAPKGRKPHDTRGYWATWKLNARGTAMEVQVNPFGGADPADRTAADCLRKALQHMQMECPRDGKVAPVRTAICL
ncbi:MAG TPA: hypothetical protein VLX92_00935 [Kofleriaceae bacterium]|nr:hypothetical protein [Kofleriaceae bacterium]